MDKLKNYAVPLIALAIMLVWFFVLRPKLDEPSSDDQQDTTAEQPAKAE